MDMVTSVHYTLLCAQGLNGGVYQALTASVLHAGLILLLVPAISFTGLWSTVAALKRARGACEEDMEALAGIYMVRKQMATQPAGTNSKLDLANPSKA